jgi:hypothetical protein
MKITKKELNELIESYINSAINEQHHDDIPDENQGGDCYQTAYHYFVTNCHQNPNLRLVHGLVTGQGQIKGIVYNHAWVEDTETDNVIDLTMPEFFQHVNTTVYYALGQIKYSVKYTAEDVLKNIQKFRTYGPWNKKLLDNPY